MWSKVKVISLGTKCEKDLILTALDQGAQKGHWVILNNCHLLEEWDEQVVRKLTRILSLTAKGECHVETWLYWLHTEGNNIVTLYMSRHLGCLFFCGHIAMFLHKMKTTACLNMLLVIKNSVTTVYSEKNRY